MMPLGDFCRKVYAIIRQGLWSRIVYWPEFARHCPYCLIVIVKKKSVQSEF